MLGHENNCVAIVVDSKNQPIDSENIIEASVAVLSQLKVKKAKPEPKQKQKSNLMVLSAPLPKLSVELWTHIVNCTTDYKSIVALSRVNILLRQILANSNTKAWIVALDDYKTRENKRADWRVSVDAPNHRQVLNLFMNTKCRTCPSKNSKVFWDFFTRLCKECVVTKTISIDAIHGEFGDNCKKALLDSKLETCLLGGVKNFGDYNKIVYLMSHFVDWATGRSELKDAAGKYIDDVFGGMSRASVIKLVEETRRESVAYHCSDAGIFKKLLLKKR